MSYIPPQGIVRRLKLSDLGELTWDSYPAADELAKVMERRPVSECVTLVNGLDDDYLASVFNSTNLSNDKAKEILNDPDLPGSKVKRIFSSANISADMVQSRLYAMADALYVDGLVKILSADAPDETVSADTTYTDGVIRRGVLTIDAGVTLTIGAGPGVIIADTVDNSGTIASGWVKGAGGPPGSSPGKGGDGTGAVIILARTVNVGTVTAKGGDGESGSTTAVLANGGDGGGGEFWVIDPDTVPSGGDGGYGKIATGSGTPGYGNPNGGGGGATLAYGYKGGDGGTATVTSFPDAQSLAKELLKCAIDWWIQNVLGKTPTTVKSLPFLGGSGGGGGLDNDAYGDCGGGGGGGGEVIIVADAVTAGTIDVSGGKGGNGGAEGSYDDGGGGGGGGIAYVLYKSLSGTTTFIVSGGSPGTNDTAYKPEPGGDGVGREIMI